MKNEDHEELVVVGRITSPHGIRGELKVWAFTPLPERFMQLHEVFLKKDQDIKIFHVTGARITPREIIISLRECKERHMAEHLVGYDICVPEAKRGILPEGYYYHDHLLEMSVYNSDGAYIGPVKYIYERNMQDCLCVMVNGKECLIPFHKNFIQSVNAVEKKIIIKSIPGLLGDDGGN